MEALQIARLLPAVYQDAIEQGSVLAALLDVMQALHAPDEVVLDHVEAYLSPRHAADPFVGMLAGWLALSPYLEDDGLGEQRVAIRPGPLRDLVSIAAGAARLRGTAPTLLAILASATGVTGFAIEESPPDAAGWPQPFHIRVVVPQAAAPQLALVRRLVAGERPAWVTFELSVAAETS